MSAAAVAGATASNTRPVARSNSSRWGSIETGRGGMRASTERGRTSSAGEIVASTASSAAACSATGT